MKLGYFLTKMRDMKCPKNDIFDKLRFYFWNDMLNNIYYSNGRARFKKCKKMNTNIYFYLESSGGPSSNLYLNVVHFSTPVLIRHLWQLNIGVLYALFHFNPLFSRV